MRVKKNELWYEVQKIDGKVEITDLGTLKDEVALTIESLEEYPYHPAKEDHVFGVIEYLEQWFPDALLGGTVLDSLDEVTEEYFMAMEARQQEEDEHYRKYGREREELWDREEN